MLLEGVRFILTQGFPEARFLSYEQVKSAERVLLVLCVTRPQRAGAYIQKYRDRFPALRTVLLYDAADQPDPLSCLTLGCRAIRKASLSGPELLDCVRLVERGLFVCEDELAVRLLKEAEKYYVFLEAARREVSAPAPTTRELEIAQGILDGLGNEEIGQKLYLSSGTVKNNIAVILEKYGFRSRTQIISLLAL